jgi:pyrimidine-nucleoside phosphorylase
LNFLALIEAKRDGQELPSAALVTFITEFTAGRLPDYQVAALLMAIFHCGLSEEETRTLTLAMRDSGTVLRFPADPRAIVDKHSTGGVGDKVSLPLAPLLACLGFRVPMISGRGLGITGGTLDKLESIPGFQTRLPPERIVAQVQNLGVAMAGQSELMVPADRKLYALRDVTGTVPSIPLITASILSKKLAEGVQALILDVKFGCAAFMRTRAQAATLAEAMVKLGQSCDVNTRALLTDMNTPLGRTAGNWLEVKEAVACLASPPHERPDLADLHHLVLECAANLLVQTGREPDLAAGMRRAQAELASRRPLRKWEELLQAQEVNLDAYHQKLAAEIDAPVVTELPSRRSGTLRHCNARIIGEVIRDMGGGRLTMESRIDPRVGLDRISKPGDEIKAGEPLCRIHAADADRVGEWQARLLEAFTLE